MKITEEKLTILEMQGMAKGFHEDSDFKDLIRLARLGLKYEQMQEDRQKLLSWAREEKIPVVANTVPSPPGAR